MDDAVWDLVENAVDKAKGMYWDGCHKIYLSMDDEDVAKMKEYGYEYHTPNLELLKEWFDQSCGLRFVNAVHTNHENPNAGYVQLIPQFFFDEDEEEFDDYDEDDL